MGKDSTCEERIEEEKEYQLHRIDQLINRMGSVNDKVADRAQEEAAEWPLSIEVIKTVRVDLSTGGPGDWFEIKTRDGELYAGSYRFQDWFDHAERALSDDEISLVWNVFALECLEVS